MAPFAGEWIHQSVLAIRADISVAVLRDTIAQFPSYSEALGTALRALPDCLETSADHEACPGSVASLV